MKAKKLTKAELIEAIQVAEQKAWVTLKRDKKIFGEDDIITKRSVATWTTLFDLREELGIENLSLPRTIELDLLSLDKVG